MCESEKSRESNIKGSFLKNFLRDLTTKVMIDEQWMNLIESLIGGVKIFQT